MVTTNSHLMFHASLKNHVAHQENQNEVHDIVCHTDASDNLGLSLVLDLDLVEHSKLQDHYDTCDKRPGDLQSGPDSHRFEIDINDSPELESDLVEDIQCGKHNNRCQNSLDCPSDDDKCEHKLTCCVIDTVIPCNYAHSLNDEIGD